MNSEIKWIETKLCKPPQGTTVITHSLEYGTGCASYYNGYFWKDGGIIYEPEFWALLPVFNESERINAKAKIKLAKETGVVNAGIDGIGKEIIDGMRKAATDEGWKFLGDAEKND